MEETAKKSFPSLPAFLAIAPVATLGIAVAYLQGYWGYFDIFVLPYLSFNEMLPYAVAPLSFIVALVVGFGAGAVQAYKPKAGWRTFNARNIVRVKSSVIPAALFAAATVTAVFFSLPGKWVLLTAAAIPLLSLLGPPALRMLQSAGINSSTAKHIMIAIQLYVIILGVSLASGELKAALLTGERQANVDVDVNGEIFRAKLVGKISSYYFFLGPDGNITQYPEASIRRIIYLR